MDYNRKLNNLSIFTCTNEAYQEPCLLTPIAEQVLPIPGTKQQMMEYSATNINSVFDLYTDTGTDSFGLGLFDIPGFECLQPTTDFLNTPFTCTDHKSLNNLSTPVHHANTESISPLNPDFENSIDIDLLLHQCQSLIDENNCEMPVLTIPETHDEPVIDEPQAAAMENRILNIITIDPPNSSSINKHQLEVSLIEENEKEFLIKIGRPSCFMTNTQTTIDLGQLDVSDNMMSDDDNDYSDCQSMHGSRQHNSKPIVKGTNEYIDKRKRNNIAVRKSRLKAKTKSKETESVVKKLTQENVSLQNKVEQLTKELNVIKGLFTHFGKSVSKNVEDRLSIIDLL